MGEVEPVVLDEVRERRARARRTSADDIFWMLERSHLQSGEPRQRAEDARRTRDDALGRPDCDVAGMGVRAPAAPSRQARAPARRGARRDSEEYLDAVVKETLRLCPAVPLVMRRLTEPMQLGGYTLAPDTIVAPCVYLMHRRADIYVDRSELQPGALPRRSGRHVHVDPFRRRRAPLRRRVLRAAGDEARDPACSRARAEPGRGGRARARRAARCPSRPTEARASSPRAGLRAAAGRPSRPERGARQGPSASGEWAAARREPRGRRP